MLPSLRQPELHNGDRMSPEEFLWRWEQIPELKQAELIEGVVYLSSPVSRPHGSYDSILGAWLNYDACAVKQDFEICHNTTVLLSDSTPQPDIYMTRLPTGGRETAAAKYLAYAPDLVVEISYSSKSLDLGPKLAAYRSAGLGESITVLLEERRAEWRVLSGTRYRLLHPATDGVLRSPNFPGLWLDTEALFPPDRQRLFAAVDRGVKNG